MITHVAVIHDGITYSLPAPNRHHDVMRLICTQTGRPAGDNEQGFLTHEGRFIGRRFALWFAQQCGQFKRGPEGYQGEELFSEDLW